MDRFIDEFYLKTEEHFKAGRFDVVDELLRTFTDSVCDFFSADVLITILTASNWAREQLPSRPEFVERCERSLRRRMDWEEGLLDGLR